MKNTLLTISLVLGTILATATPFITKWDLSKQGSGANQISFKATTTGPVNYTWETVPLSSNSGSGILVNGTDSITGLPANAIVRLKIDSVNFTSFVIGNTENSRLIDIEQWGSINWQTMYSAFTGCYSLNISATDIPNLNNVTNMSSMFASCSNLNGPNNINSWNTSNVTNMGGLFSFTPLFNQAIGNWNTSSVTNMSGLFLGATVFNQAIGNWNTSNVTNMALMFDFASAFNQAIGNWNTSNDTDLSYMFSDATAFNQAIGNWNTINVTNINAIFYKASAFNQAIGNWNLSHIPPTMFSSQLESMLDSSGIDCHNYASTLNGWANNTSTPNNLTFGATNIHYGTNAVADRNTLINTKGWTINGDIADATACYPTSIATTNPSNTFSLSPNPTQGTISISSAQAGTFTLYNMMGQAVYSTTLLGNSTKESKTLPALPASIYNYILTTTNGEKVVGKLQVQ